MNTSHEPYHKLLMTLKWRLVVQSNDIHEIVNYCHELVPGRSPL